MAIPATSMLKTRLGSNGMPIVLTAVGRQLDLDQCVATGRIPDLVSLFARSIAADPHLADCEIA